MEVDHTWYTILVVQREDATIMGTIKLEEVYQGRYVKLGSSKTIVG
jgi:hypothetical protein